jgi:hypothetical protein
MLRATVERPSPRRAEATRCRSAMSAYRVNGHASRRAAQQPRKTPDMAMKSGALDRRDRGVGQVWPLSERSAGALITLRRRGAEFWPTSKTMGGKAGMEHYAGIDAPTEFLHAEAVLPSPEHPSSVIAAPAFKGAPANAGDAYSHRATSTKIARRQRRGVLNDEDLCACHRCWNATAPSR